MAVNKVQLGNQTIIDLTGDTISAGDALVGVSLHLATGEAVTGTLSDFTGTDGQNPGTHGLVPAPAVSDVGKFLSSSGAWQTVSSGGGSSFINKPLTVTAAGWTQDASGAYLQTVAVTGVDLTAVTEALVDLNMSTATVATATDLQEDWSLIGRVYVDTTGAHFVCFGESPIADLPVVLRLAVAG